MTEFGQELSSNFTPKENYAGMLRRWPLRRRVIREDSS